MRDEWSGSKQLAVEAVGNLIAFCSSFFTMFPFIPHRSSIWRRIGDCRKWSQRWRNSGNARLFQLCRNPVQVGAIVL